LIVSDADGLEMVKHLKTKGVNFNKTICNFIVKINGIQSDTPPISNYCLHAVDDDLSILAAKAKQMVD
jgi:hypothetical protein